MQSFKRYAVYFCPAGALGARGAAWLGWDIFSAAPIAQPQLPGLDAATLTQTPRKYGFHATVKPPFALAKGKTAPALADAFDRLCKESAPVQLDGLELAALGRFLALRPMGDDAPLRALAAQVVRTLDPFRAPPDAAELARRRQAHLSPRQEENLTTWGYPYVMEDFRFHLTLTGKLPKAALLAAQEALTSHFAPVLPRPCVINTLSLVGERADGQFEHLQSRPLLGL